MTGKNLSEQSQMEEAYAYFRKREAELGGKFEIAYTMTIGADGVYWGLRAVFQQNLRSASKYNLYQSIYVFEQYRNSGYMSQYVDGCDMLMPFITMDDCNIESWFQKKQVPYLKVFPCGK